MKTQYERLMQDAEFRRLFAIEGLVTDAAELVARLMEKRKVKKAELAKRLGKSRSYVTQLLSGSTNMTVRTLAEVVYALGAEVKLEALSHEAAQQRPSFAQMKHVVALTRSPRVARPTGRPLPKVSTKLPN